MQTITPSSIQYISQVLSNPHSITEEDAESINTLRDSFPYFVPARYLESALSHKRQPFSPALLTNMQLYKGNWLLYSYFLNDTLGKEKPISDEELDKLFAANTNTELTEPYKVPDYEDTEEINYDEGMDASIIESILFQDDAVEATEAEPVVAENDETLILPVYTEDYFFHQGVQVSNNIPEQPETAVEEDKKESDEDKSLMVVMSFSEWLMHYKRTVEKEQEEKEDKKALKTMWQKEKLAAALEEEDDEIPENVFEMAVNSITKEEDLASEPLAEIYIKQGKLDKAIEMYRKLSLRNPQKNAYFARKIEEIKEKQL